MKCFLVMLIVLCTISAKAQFLLKGRLIDSSTEKRLAGASIYLNNTSIGTVSNEVGEFALLVPPGTYELVVTFVGYETFSGTIVKNDTTTLVIKMTPKAKMLDEVVVASFEKDGWRKYGNFFLEQFIGNSEIALSCRIKNHKTLRFRRNKEDNTLTVVADEPLIIENKALGYTIQYQLEAFQYYYTDRFLVYFGYPLFIPMEGNAKKQNEWQANRDEVFEGSLMHFLRVLFRNKIKEAGYEVRRLVKTRNVEKERIQELYRSGLNAKDSSEYYQRIIDQPDEFRKLSPDLLTGDSVGFELDSVTVGIEFPDYLQVNYPSKSPSGRYMVLAPQNRKMISELTIVNGEPLKLRSNGSLDNPINLITLGYWSWSEKLGMLLPLDFKPSPMVSNKGKFKRSVKTKKPPEEGFSY